jgi:hypothetical protein
MEWLSGAALEAKEEQARLAKEAARAAKQATQASTSKARQQLVKHVSS